MFLSETCFFYIVKFFYQILHGLLFGKNLFSIIKKKTIMLYRFLNMLLIGSNKKAILVQSASYRPCQFENSFQS